MVSVMAEERPFEIGGSSLLVSPPRYKRRKVYAIRDFPDGCGPYAVEIISQKKQEEIVGQKEGGVLSNVEFGVENDRVLCEVVKKTKLEGKHESRKHVCDNKLVEERVDVREGTSKQPCSLPHYPMPPNFVWKKPTYPPRREVSAIRDFPMGCGKNVSKLGGIEEENVVGQGETNLKSNDVIDPNSTNITEEVDTLKHYCKDEISVEKVGGQVDNELEQLECNGNDEKDTSNLSDELNKERKEGIVAFGSDNKRVIVLGLTSLLPNPLREGKGLVKITPTKPSLKKTKGMEKCNFSGESPLRTGKSLVNFTPTTPSVKKTMGKKKCNLSGENTPKSLPDKSKDKDKNKRVVVLCNTSTASANKLMGNKCDFSDDDTLKSSDKSKDDNQNLAEKSTMMIPYLEEDIGEVYRPLDMTDSDDSSENDDLDDFQLVPRVHDLDFTLPSFGASSSSNRGARSKVRETLRLFQAFNRQLLQEEAKSKDKVSESKRTDMRAAKIFKDRGKCINAKKVIGSVPGIEVGDVFNYRTELAVIGLHGPFQGGIDIIKLDGEFLAISIVASGVYDNDVSSDVLIYTGQGGNTSSKDKQPEDQKLEKGNLGLKNCIDKKTFVRVIRGMKESNPSEIPGRKSKTTTTYTYDGLYTVDRYWQELGSHGKLVYKFELNRVPGQPELAWKEVKQSKKFMARNGRCVSDISGRKENIPICAVNTIDDEKPPFFTYITSMMYPDWCQPIPSKGCNCKNVCSENCACALKNGGEIPYNYSGAIVRAKPLVYECGPLCKCPPTCYNRVSQHGIKLPLEIFKTNSMGWGVRCLSSISSGSFICEYIGELLDDKEAEQRTGYDEYLFDIGQNYNDPALWEGLSSLFPDLTSGNDDVIDVGFTIDAANCGNVGRFINHSCTPNLYAQNVLYDHEDKRIPHIMFFAAENIPPLQELTYHYNYTIDQVKDSEGNIKKKSCYCGSAECTGRMY